MRKVKIITLGCSKNSVDSEIIGGILDRENITVAPDFEDGEAIIINTCGFIDTARKESIVTIVEAIEEKKAGKFAKVFVTGCMADKFRADLISALPEVDAVFGLKDFDAVAKAFGDKKIGKDENLFKERIALEADHVAYIRISDGCNHNCAYCSIPSMRGKYVSRTPDSILEEVATLVKGGVKEFILIGQEISGYGLDLYKEKRVNQLLTDISSIVDKDHWIRLMYTYPPFVDEKFMRTVAELPNLCKYLDFPIEHSETAILKAMKRGETREKLMDKIRMMREIIPGIALRTSIITGFPGEDRHHFNQMLKFLAEVRFDRLGCFPYSPEEGTPALLLPGRPTRRTAENRVAKIMTQQQEISFDNNLELVGSVQKVLVDSFEGEYAVGRTYRDAPDIDNEVLITDPKQQLEVGSFYNVKIEKASEFDLFASLVK